MRRSTRTVFTATITLAAIGLLAVACGGQNAPGGEDVDAIAASLEQDNGGFDLQDESMLFSPGELALPEGFDFNADAIRNAELIMSQIPELPEGVLEEQTGPMPAEGDPSELPAPEIGKPEVGPNAQRPDCPRLLMLGKWKPVAKGFGALRAILVAPTPWDSAHKGKVVGFVKGIYGRGHFVGKAVRKNGQGWALLKGLYGNGHFKGRLKTPAGFRGLVHGKYAPGKLAGVMALLCKPLCEKVCPDSFQMLPEGGCSCQPACPDGKELDICPKKIRACVQVAVSDGDADPAAQGDDGFAPVGGGCRVRCAPPVCRPPLPPTGTPTAPDTDDAPAADTEPVE